MADDIGQRFEVALGELLQRKTRLGLYADLVDGIGRGLDTTSYPLLSGVARLGPLTASSLGHEVGLDRSGVSRHVTRLVDGGLLARQPDPADARGTLLALTEDGRRTVHLLRQRLGDVLGHCLEDWPPSQAHAFVAGLERFVHENRSGIGAPLGRQAPARPGPLAG